MDKVRFIKTLITDILSGERRTWKEYSIEFSPGQPEKLRHSWRQFKDSYYNQGLWCEGKAIESEWLDRANSVIASISTGLPLSDSGTLTAVKSDGTIMNIEEYCDFYNIPFNQVKSYKLITHTGKCAYYNITSTPMDLQESSMQLFADRILQDLSIINTLPKTVVRDSGVTDPHLLLLSLADLHIGKLADSFETGEDYNNQIAVKRAKDGVIGILNKAKGFPVEKIVFIGGNDILHIDTPKRTTTSGTPQDTDGMWYSNFLIAKQLYIEIIHMLLEVADVHFVFNPSNHDYMSGFFLADLIKTYFKDCENITFDCSISHRKYITYGDNLIGTTHGDGAKIENLPLLMAHESSDWSRCKHRYIYFHHIHHKTSKDFLGVCVESFRSPSSADSWHHRNGYQHAPKAIEGFIHHPNFGQIAKLTHLF